jgi:hypothetical protein
MNSYNRLYVNGCSFSCAGGLHWDEVKKVYENELGIKIVNHLDCSYSNIIGKKLNLKVTNDSIPGGSVNRLIRTTYQYIFNNLKNIKETLFLLEIPPGWRDELYSNELNRLINVTITSIHSYSDKTDVANGNNPNDLRTIHPTLTNYFYNFVNYEEFDRNKMMNNLLGLLSYMKLNEIKFFVNDAGGDFYSFLTFFNKLNSDYNFLWIENEIPMMSWMKDCGLLISDETKNLVDDPHLGIKGNEYVANIFHKQIIENEKN